ncbi:MAG: phospholipase D family protein [Colwellia sp.]|nr:phospholipase D family protein [Colwellia sp.]NQY90011.1 DNA repair protein [Colwellia sp.]
MAKFLNTSATNYYLEELIKSASDRLILISPYLKLNDRIKELLEDKNRLKIDVRIIYGKSELQPLEISWLNELSFVRTSFCKNLHAKCYLNESSCIITSLNLYEFSQVNNNEMGVYVSRDDDPAMYKDTYEEAQRIIRISDEVRISLEKIEKAVTPALTITSNQSSENDKTSKMTSSKLAIKLKLKTAELFKVLITQGYVEEVEDKHILTDKGLSSGGEAKKGRFGAYIIWPDNFNPISTS